MSAVIEHCDACHERLTPKISGFPEMPEGEWWCFGCAEGFGLTIPLSLKQSSSGGSIREAYEAKQREIRRAKFSAFLESRKQQEVEI